MSTDELLTYVAGYLEFGQAPSGRPYHMELCRRLKNGARGAKVAARREDIRCGTVVFEALTSTSAPKMSDAETAVAAYSQGGWEAFDHYCAGRRSVGKEPTRQELINAGLLRTAAACMADAFVSGRSKTARKKVHEHLTFLGRYGSKDNGWLISTAFANAARQWIQLGENELAARLYRGAYQYAPKEMVRSAFEARGLDIFELSRVHRYSLPSRVTLQATAA